MLPLGCYHAPYFAANPSLNASSGSSLSARMHPWQPAAWMRSTESLSTLSRLHVSADNMIQAGGCDVNRSQPEVHMKTDLAGQAVLSKADGSPLTFSLLNMQSTHLLSSCARQTYAAYSPDVSWAALQRHCEAALGNVNMIQTGALKALHRPLDSAKCALQVDHRR